MNLKMIWLFSLPWVILTGPGFSQDRLSAPPYAPANLSMTYPVPWSPSTDTVPPDLRRRRDEYFDKLIGLPAPLTPENAAGSGFSEGARLGNQPETLDVPNRAIVIATISQYQPVLSKSGRSIYAEAGRRRKPVWERHCSCVSGRLGEDRCWSVPVLLNSASPILHFCWKNLFVRSVLS